MKSKRLTLSVLFVVAAVANALACTNLIVGKNASADGSTIVSYSADSYGLFGELYHYPAGMHKKGTLIDIHEWDTGKYLGQIAQARQTYNVIGNMNEFQLTIGETTFGGRPELVDTTGIIDYGSLIYLGLQRSRTAREAIKVMTELVQEYGYYSSGESFTIADPNEIWIMEMIGKGPGVRGAVWVAVRVPDDCISAHANQSRIHQFNMNDKENCMYSADVISFAREKGYFDGVNKDFSFADAYAPLDFGARRYCEARVWSYFNMFTDRGNEFLPYILGETNTPMPLFVKPNRKVSVQDVKMPCATIMKVLLSTSAKISVQARIIPRTAFLHSLSKWATGNISMSVPSPPSKVVSYSWHRCVPSCPTLSVEYCGLARMMPT